MNSIGQNSTVKRKRDQTEVLMTMQRIYIGLRLFNRSAKAPHSRGNKTSAIDLKADNAPI